MIPRKIFYIWIGSKEPDELKATIKSWSKITKNYHIIGINSESEYFDIDKEKHNCRWFKEIFEKKLWSFVSDYIRLKVIYEYGGIYLDTDITIIKEFDDLLNNEFFAGHEDNNLVNLSVFGANKKHDFIKSILNFYQNEIWTSTLYTIPEITTHILKTKYKYDIKKREFNSSLLENSISIYPKEFFYPFHYTEKFTNKCITNNTYTVHWWNNSWSTDDNILWLSNKHLLNKIKDIKNINKKFYLQNTHHENIGALSIFGYKIIRYYKVGRFYLFKFFSVPLILTETLGKNIKIYLFSTIFLFKLERKYIISLKKIIINR